MPENFTRRSFLKIAGWTTLSSMAGSFPGFLNKHVFSQSVMDTIHKSHCPLCPQGCGVDLVIKSGKLIEVSGMIEDPETRGLLCVLGKTLPEVIASQNRITTPLKRTGVKGEGRFAPISWDEALRTIVQQWTQIIQNDGSQSIAGYLGHAMSLESYFLLPRLLYALGSPNIFLPEGQGEGAWAWAGKLTVGSFPSVSFENWDKTKCFILWGHNPDDSSPCTTAQWIKEQKNKGSKLIVIDPRKISLAEEAVEWIPIRPGTDGALAWSMAQVIIKENLYNNEFIGKWTDGFRGFKEIALREEYQVKKVATLCGIDPEQIERTARLYSQNNPSLILGGGGVSQHGSGLQNSRAIHCLALLTGNVNKPGSNLYYSYPLEPATGFAALQERVERTGILNRQLVKLPLGYSDSVRLWDLLLADGSDLYWKDYIFRRALSEGRPPFMFTDVYSKGYQGNAYPLKSLIVLESDPLKDLPNSLKGRMAFKKLPFLVMISPFINESALYADIILPSTIGPESTNLVSCNRPLSSQYLRLNKQAIAPRGECKSYQDIICSLAYKMGFGRLFSFTDREFANMVLKSSPFTQKLSYQELSASPLPLVPLYQVRDLFPHPSRDSFETPSGKAMFASTTLSQLGFNPYPEWYPPLESKAQTPEFFNKYPLILVTGNTFPNNTSMMKDEVLINPQDAQDHDLREGLEVWIESKINKVKRKIKISQEVSQGVVWIAKPMSTIIFEETKGLEVNNLIDDQNNDPITGTPRFNEMLVKVYPA